MVINAVAFDHAVSLDHAETLGMGQPLNGKDPMCTCGIYTSKVFKVIHAKPQPDHVSFGEGIHYLAKEEAKKYSTQFTFLQSNHNSHTQTKGKLLMIITKSGGIIIYRSGEGLGTLQPGAWPCLLWLPTCSPASAGGHGAQPRARKPSSKVAQRLNAWIFFFKANVWTWPYFSVN